MLLQIQSYLLYIEFGVSTKITRNFFTVYFGSVSQNQGFLAGLPLIKGLYQKDGIGLLFRGDQLIKHLRQMKTAQFSLNKS